MLSEINDKCSSIHLKKSFKVFNRIRRGLNLKNDYIKIWVRVHTLTTTKGLLRVDRGHNSTHDMACKSPFRDNHQAFLYKFFNER